jgi:hypothetical protein
MSFPVDLPQGDHALAAPVVHWNAEFVDAIPPAVKLIASIESGRRQTTAPNQGQTATSLAIQMDARVASDLYLRLADLGRRMGWLPQTPAADRA